MKHRHKLLATAVLLAASAGAQAQIYKAVLTGANEVPPVTTAGTGVGVVSLNTTTHELRLKTTFTGLNGGTTASHIHCCTAPGANAGVATMLPSFTGFPAGVTAGSFDGTFNTSQASTWNAAFVTANGGTPAGAESRLSSALDAGQAYLNIHTSTSPGGEVRANLQRFSFVPASSSGRTTGLAYALDQMGAGTGAANERLMSLAMLDNAQLGAALVQLLPMPTNAVVSTLTNGLYADYDQISNRLGGLRGESEVAHGLWVRYADRQNELELGLRGTEVESDGQDLSLGLDHSLDSGLLLGIAVSLSEDEFELDRAMLGTSGELEGWRGTFYAEQELGVAFVEGMVTIAHSDVDHERMLGGLNNRAMAEDDTDQVGARIAIGTDIVIRNGDTGFRATPQLRVDYSNVEFGGYVETSASGLGLTVDSQDYDSLRVGLGAQLDWTMASGFNPFVRAFWNTEVENGDTMTRARFGNGLWFESIDAGPDSAGYTAGLGVNFVQSEGFGASLSYDVMDNDEFQSDVFQARVLWRY